MPNRPATPPKYRLYKPKGLAVVRIDGKDHYLGKHGSPESWEKYHRLLAERAASPLAAGLAVESTAEPTPPRPDPTIAEVMLGYWGYVQSYYRTPDGRPTGEQQNIKLALRPLRRLYGSTPAREFGPLALKAVRQSMVDSGLSRTTINFRVGKIVRLFRWAVENELVPPSSHHALASVSGLRKGRSPAPEPPPVRPVADADVDAIRPFVPAQVWTMIQLQRLTGARPSEVVNLRSGEIDRSGDVWVAYPAHHKTSHHGIRRAIVIGPRAREVLAPWLRDDPDEFLFQPKEAVQARNNRRRAARVTPMTPSQRSRKAKPDPVRPPGETYSKNAYRTAIWRGCDKAHPHPTLAGIKKRDLTDDQRAELKSWRKAHRWHPHQIRHAVATAVRAKYGLEAAQVVLGHSKADVTEIYAERNLTRAVEVMREIG